MRRILSFMPPPIKKSLLLALACVLMPAAMLADTTNLLTNPGAEAGSLSGWTAVGGSFSVNNGMFGPVDPHTGSFDFFGLSSDISQTVSVFTQGITAAMVNTGTLSAQLSFWEQGVNLGSSSGFGLVALEFFDGTTDLETATETVIRTTVCGPKERAPFSFPAALPRSNTSWGSRQTQRWARSVPHSSMTTA